MKVYIQTDETGDYHNVNAYVAMVGFKALGYEIVKFNKIEEVNNLETDTMFVGGIGMIRKRLKQLNIAIPEEIEYPEELAQFLNRKVWRANLSQLIQNTTTGIFVKPVQTKLFTGKLINEFKDYFGLKYTEEVPVWCSEPVPVITEWRCFIRYGTLVDVRYYKGKWDSKIDLDVVESAIKAFKSQPAAYCLDFGVDANGKHYLIEFNDGHSIGSYGMGPITYAKFLSARWAELTGTKDMLYF